MIEIIVRAICVLGFLVVIVSFEDQDQNFWTWFGSPGWGPMRFKLWLTGLALVLLWKLARFVMRMSWAVIIAMIAQAGPRTQT
jgi:hypothetical protein